MKNKVSLFARHIEDLRALKELAQYHAQTYENKELIIFNFWMRSIRMNWVLKTVQ